MSIQQDILNETEPTKLGKESLLSSDRVKLTIIAVVLNFLVAAAAKYLEIDMNELLALIAGNTALFGNMVIARTKRNTA